MLERLFFVILLLKLSAAVTAVYGESSFEYQKFLTIFSKENLPGLINSMKDAQVSDKCLKDLSIFGTKLADPLGGFNKDYWYLKMLDASGEIPSGIFYGNTMSMGSFSSCLEVDVKLNIDGMNDSEGFRGRYYSAYIIPELAGQSYKRHQSQTWKIPLPIKTDKHLRYQSGIPGMSLTRVGFCFPSSCSDDDLQMALQSAITAAIGNLSLDDLYQNVTVVTYGSMSEADIWHFDALDIFAITLTCLIGLLILCGTGVEIWSMYSPLESNPFKNSHLGTFLLGFSAYRNTKALLSVSNKDAKGSSEYLQCLNGIRFFSMTWVLLCHVFGNLSLSPNNNFVLYFPELVTSYAFQPVLNGFPSVDTFFLLSGCLVAYITLKELDKAKGRINWFIVVIHRYLRLTGVYAYIVLLNASLIRITAGGPSDQTLAGIKYCRDSWWKNLLYITNYAPENEGIEALGCIGQTWYLDNDMQMFLITPFIIYPLWKSPILGLALAGIWTAASAIVPTVLTVVRDWPATNAVDPSGTNDYFQYNYIVPWCRFSPYICGILLGYALHKTKGRNFKMARELNVLLWLVAFVIGYLVIYGLNLPDLFMEVYLEGKMPSTAFNATYGGFHRLAWGVAVSWVIFACCRGYGGLINSFLSWEAFEPLSRLTYIMYLVHITIINYLAARDDFTVEWNHSLVIIRILSVTVFSCIISAIFFVAIEVPWSNTEKFIFSIILPGKKKTKPN